MKKVSVSLDVHWNTKHKTRSLQSGSLSQVVQKFESLNIHFIYSNSEFSHQVCSLTTYAICRRVEEKVWYVFLSPSLWWPWEFDFCPASVFLLSRLWGLFISPRCKGSHFSPLPDPASHPACTYSTHVDFHFSYSSGLSPPPPQGWLKTGGQTFSSVGGMHVGE